MKTAGNNTIYYIRCMYYVFGLDFKRLTDICRCIEYVREYVYKEGVANDGISHCYCLIVVIVIVVSLVKVPPVD